MSNLATRILTAIVLVPVVVGGVYAGGVWLSLLLAMFAGVGAWELYRIARAGGTDPFDALGIPVAAALPLAVHATMSGWLDRPLAAAGVVFVALIGVAVFARAPGARPLESVSVTLFGALYAGATLACAYAIRHHRWVIADAAGTVLLLLPVVVTWATDIGAYAFGRWLGRRKLLPAVSPGKTVAGAVGGAALGVVVALVWNAYVLRPTAQVALTTTAAGVFGLVVSAAAQIGDLAESLFKRQAGVKDSSNAIPGHGGVLDRLDSLYFVLPVAYLLLGRFLLAAPR
jgi:phosphatidate cytidylyltransferase